MGIRGMLQDTVVTAFLALGDMVRPATYKALTGVMIRDLDAGTAVPQSLDYPIRGAIIVSIQPTEDDKDAHTTTTAKFICPQAWLEISPNAADLIVDYKGRTWEITKDISDSADAAVILLLRTSR